MSSYYTTARLEEMRKAKLKQELSDSIQNLRAQLQKEHENTVQTAASSNIVLSVFQTDDAVSGCISDAAVSGASLKISDEHAKRTGKDLDFSDLLCSARKKPGKLELELDSWIKRIDERPVIEEKDAADRARLLAEVAKTLSDDLTDIEDKIRSVKMRVSSYLQGAAKLTDNDKAQLESSYFQYCALCSMLGVKPAEQLPFRVKAEIERMTSVLEQRRQNEYIMDVVQSIMEELGCHVKDDAILDHTAGQMFSVDGHPLCDVFVGNDGRGIMFEPVGESREGSLDRRRQIEHSANSVCSMYAVLEQRAAERGVILNRVYCAPARIGEMCVQSDVSGRTAKRERRRGTVEKQREMDSEV